MARILQSCCSPEEGVATDAATPDRKLTNGYEMSSRIPTGNQRSREHPRGGRAVSGLKAFLRDQGGAVAAEYVILLAALGICCVAGIVILMGGLNSLFSAYATYFQPPS